MKLPTILIFALCATYVSCIVPPPSLSPGDGCERCTYYNGIGYAADLTYCTVFHVCQKSPGSYDGYTYYPMCCPEGLIWDQELLTCRFPYFGMNLDCERARPNHCPDHEINDGPCPFMFVGGEPTKFRDTTTEYEWMCPYGTEWDQALCTCQINASALYSIKRCDKLVHFDFFNGSVVSDSCYNLVQGSVYGDDAFFDDTLCLNGEDQFFEFNFFNNWFVRNPVAETFTLCFWFQSATEGQEAGLFSFNCEFATQGSVLEIYSESDQLWMVTGSNESQPCGGFPGAGVWYHVCVSFDHGNYTIYLQGSEIDQIQTDPEPINSQSSTTLGYVHGFDPFQGYFDDFCFFTSVLDASDINNLYTQGPSCGSCSNDS